MFKVEVSGFRTKEEAQEFVNWYCQRGEQDIALMLFKAKTNFERMDFDATNFPFKWDDDTLQMVLNVS